MSSCNPSMCDPFWCVQAAAEAIVNKQRVQLRRQLTSERASAAARAREAQEMEDQRKEAALERLRAQVGLPKGLKSLLGKDPGYSLTIQHPLQACMCVIDLGWQCGS